MIASVPGQWAYDNAEPLPTGDKSELTAHVYERKDLDEWLVLFINDNPELAQDVLNGNAKTEFENWYFLANRDEILENAA